MLGAAAALKLFFSSLPWFLRKDARNLLDEANIVNFSGSSSSSSSSSSSGGNEKNTTSSEFIPMYYTAREASLAYRDGLLKSDFNISSNHTPIRVAFRYVSEDEESGASGRDKSNNALIMCWVGQDGTPHHFYPLPPAKRPKTASHGSGSNNKIANSTGANDVLLVNETDHIETTFPGHAFVFCRRVEFNYPDDGNATQTGGQDADERQSSPIVVDHDGKTLFLRRRRKRQHSESTGSDEQEDKDNEDDVWEAYLLEGGYRPDVAPPEPQGDHSDEDEEEDDDSERVRLVTITAIANENKQPLAKEEEDDDDIPSESLGCFSCIRTIPFLRRGAASNSLQQVMARPIENSEDAKQSQRNELDSDQINDNARLLQVNASMTRLDPTPIDTSSKHYDRVVLGGWPCRLEPGCFPDDIDEHNNITHRSFVRDRFEADLNAACQSLPPTARAKLQKSTPIWINKSLTFGPKAAPIRGRHACFHPGSKWLVRNGMSAAKCGGVEFYNPSDYLSDCDLWGPGGLILHELSHAWHCLHNQDAYENPLIKECYEKAMEDGLYECVPVHGPQGPRCRAYACQDQMEYFAELSVAFLGGRDETKEHNKWFPFNRAQLKKHDPRAFQMLCRVWNVDENCCEIPSDNEQNN